MNGTSRARIRLAALSLAVGLSASLVGAPAAHAGHGNLACTDNSRYAGFWASTQGFGGYDDCAHADLYLNFGPVDRRGGWTPDNNMVLIPAGETFSARWVVPHGDKNITAFFSTGGDTCRSHVNNYVVRHKALYKVDCPAGTETQLDADGRPVVKKTSLGAHVDVDQAGNYYCFGQKATVVGTPGDDVLYVKSPADVVVALGGNDQVYTYAAHDDTWTSPITTANAATISICTGDGNDVVSLGAGHIDTGAGPDQVYTGDPEYVDYQPPANAQIYGGAGNDEIEDWSPSSTVHGGAGNDYLRGAKVYGDGGNDTLGGTDCYGGAGTDTDDQFGYGHDCIHFTQ